MTTQTRARFNGALDAMIANIERWNREVEKRCQPSRRAADAMPLKRQKSASQIASEFEAQTRKYHRKNLSEVAGR